MILAENDQAGLAGWAKVSGARYLGGEKDKACSEGSFYVRLETG
jgi:hypothetical protein